MQKPNDTKRTDILRTAARLFASKPFHEVKLDDVAAEASVGKGTLYVYFTSKEALYAAVIDEAFARVVTEIRASLEVRDMTVWESVRVFVTELVRFGRTFPDKFRLMREGVEFHGPCGLEARNQLIQLMTDVLKQGVQRGELADEHPELSATYVLSSVRGALLYGSPDLPEQTVIQHILRVVGNGLLPPTSSSRTNP